MGCSGGDQLCPRVRAVLLTQLRPLRVQLLFARSSRGRRYSHKWLTAKYLRSTFFKMIALIILNSETILQLPLAIYGFSGIRGCYGNEQL